MSRKKNRKNEYCVLEGRRLLAVSTTLTGSTLSIQGDASANTIRVEAVGNFIDVVGDTTARFNASDITTIEFFGAAGDDFFENTTDIDTLAVGQAGNDELVTAGGTDRLFGGDGNDTLISTGGNDRLIGNNGEDVLFGGDGNDAIFGLGGNDELHGGDGNDNLVAGFGDDVVFGGDGNDLVFGHFGNDQIFGEGGDDNLFGQNDDDFISGGEGNDNIRGNGGDDTLEGNNGDDRLLGDADNDQIEGGDGDEIIFGGNGDDTLIGGNGNDLLFAGNGNDEVFGNAGNDVLRGNLGNDTLSGGDNADRIAGDGGDDFLDGGTASDVVLGNAGNDTIVGASRDRVTGGAGDDLIDLGSGDGDIVNFSQNFADYVVTQSSDALVVRDTTGNDGQDIITGADTAVFADGSRTAEAEVTRRVFIQPIVVSDSNGTNTAESFGDSETQFEIERLIDEIYLQAGIDVEFLPENTTNNTFFNTGTGTGTRNQFDLPTIVTTGDRSGLGSIDPLVLDLYFVNRVPGFTTVSASTANGLAFVGGSGIALHTGENLLNSDAGLALIARVTAHEIGHNLGLNHVSGSNNLLGSGTDLNASQIAAVQSSRFSQTLDGTAAGLASLDNTTVQSTFAQLENDSDTSGGCGCGGCGCAACGGGALDQMSSGTSFDSIELSLDG